MKSRSEDMGDENISDEHIIGLISSINAIIEENYSDMNVIDDIHDIHDIAAEVYDEHDLNP